MQRFEPPNKPCKSVAVVQNSLFEDLRLRFWRSLLSSLCSLLRCFSFLRMPFALLTSKFASGHRLCSEQAFELCFTPSTPLPTASMLGGIILPSTPLPIASMLGGIILGPNYFLLRPTHYFILRPSHLDCDCLSFLASLCALPSSLVGPDPFLHHPALVRPCKNAVNLAGGCCCVCSCCCCCCFGS